MLKSFFFKNKTTFRKNKVSDNIKENPNVWCPEIPRFNKEN